MKLLHQFWNIVPNAVRTPAFAIAGLVALLGLTAGIVEGRNSGQPLLPLAGIGGGLLLGSLIATWILCLGFVYADARRRAMPPIPWTLIAAFVPNLLGFLFYFALRKPLAAPCPHCGRPLETGQRFCSWCGCERTAPPSSQMLSQAPGAPS